MDKYIILDITLGNPFFALFIYIDFALPKPLFNRVVPRIAVAWPIPPAIENHSSSGTGPSPSAMPFSLNASIWK